MTYNIFVTVFYVVENYDKKCKIFSYIMLSFRITVKL